VVFATDISLHVLFTNSIVGIMTHYRLDGQILVVVGGGVSVSIQMPWDPPNLLHNGYQRSFPRGKVAEA
jgi:hypothetical protein